MPNRRRSHVATMAAVLAGMLTLGPSLAAQGPVPPGAAVAPRSASERMLYALENDWTAAIVHRDASEFRRFTAPGWVYSDERGVLARDSAIVEFTSGPDTVMAAGNEQMRAHVYGSSAVVTGILVMRGHHTAGPFERRYRYTDTWVRLDGRWRCVASQDYEIPRP